MKPKYIDTLISEAMLIEAESAKDAGTLGYMARAMVQATMPHKKTTELVHERVNGDFTLTMMAKPKIGLPYGSTPRLMLAWIGSEVVKTGEQKIVLGGSMSAFLRELDLLPTGGRWGSITRLKDQSKRLFSCAISADYDSEERFKNKAPFGIGSADLWWDVQAPEQLGIFQSTLELSDQFYREVMEHPIPVDMRVLKLLKRSPMALDVYAWLSYRMFTLSRSKRSEVLIPWESLQMQFGAGYPETTRGRLDFKRAFLREMTKIKTLAYNDARVSDGKAGLILKQSPLHLPTRPPKKPHETS
jgi:hypothetical protein